MKAVRLNIAGIVQGVGFRPFVRRIAIELGIPGWIRNTSEGVCIAVPEHVAELVQQQLIAEQPRLSKIDCVTVEPCEDDLTSPFEIRVSTTGDAQTAVAADASICSDCIKELNDPFDRRHHYPFLNCTNCGPRFSIAKGIPYDRSNTTMAAFDLCSDCQTEYRNMSDRRYHAQPVACPRCGPNIWFKGKASAIEESNQDGNDDGHIALQLAIDLVQSGGLLALRGIGGFHLACLACDEAAVSSLRQRKNRPTKPLAVMVRDIEMAKQYALIDSTTEALLTSAVAPIVLTPINPLRSLAPSVLNGLGKVGLMLPYSPLHLELIASFDSPLVMTSGNHSAAPQITSNETALAELDGIADGWLLHNREIENRVDDSLVQQSRSGTQVLRCARGLAPNIINLPKGIVDHPHAIAFGADSKNTFALAKGGRAIMSQHMGDLVDPRTADDMFNNIERLSNLFDVRPGLVMCDMHEGYQSSRMAHAYAKAFDLPIITVQHHHAHAASLMVEHQIDSQSDIFALIQDGIGIGPDGDIWGAEALRVSYSHAERLATLSPTALPGGDAAAHEPWRNLVAQLFARYGAYELWPQHYRAALAEKPVETVCAAISARINAPKASSAGRLFDAVAAALGYAPTRQSYEGEAAIRLEHAATEYIDAHGAPEPLKFDWLNGSETLDSKILDPASIWDELRMEKAKESTACAAARFQLGWADAWAAMASDSLTGTPIGLSGGSFQNQLISNRIVDSLTVQSGRRLLLHSTVPPNDGGIALGQLAVGLTRHQSRK